MVGSDGVNLVLADLAKCLVDWDRRSFFRNVDVVLDEVFEMF